MKQEPVVIEQILNTSIDKVWKAISEKEQMKQWYFDLAEFKPEPGFEFQFEGGKDDRSYIHLCRITRVVPRQYLQYSWQYEGFDGNTIVTFELFEKGNKTRLKLTHEGLETLPSTNPDFARENFVAGWNHIIGSSIKELIEK